MNHKVKILAFTSIIAMLSCSAETQQSSLKETWDYSNSPVKMKDQFTELGFTTSLELLPENARVSKEPWSGDYWPTYKGGITYRWNMPTNNMVERVGYDLLTEEAIAETSSEDLAQLSPAEKYDLYVGDSQFSLTQFERDRTAVMKTIPGSSVFDPDYKIPSWEGLCHAWAPATIAFESPNPVTVRSLDDKYDLSFGASDIKALLTYFVHYETQTSGYFLGQRCNAAFEEYQADYEAGTITLEELNRRKSTSRCKGINPGSFHIVLANQIGLQDSAFVIDKTRDAQVWNQPVIAYDSVVFDTDRDGNPIEIYDSAASGTTKVVRVMTDMNYTTEIRHSFANTDHEPSELHESYEYYLELDANGEIIGGEWLTENRPDFMWKHDLPYFSGLFGPLEDIYLESIE